ncbi:MarR family transcriptional regulator [Stutzerimonas stutzeri]|uniref:MarR family transcriptional regulator n=1 Tax=Stutzerimonas stutzeri TaxID=316 RepID=W8R794_STUST|nr:MarR family transcriptional regulator [Stutzerimonas stutzeri]AHL75453.1 MarR family transcriptional regulator [Stutzerimonas stutzeri]MCQ4327980.1 MarR family transcriptional regulator [Stutzerimonas stutzeri]
MTKSTNDSRLAEEVFESIHSLMHLYRSQQYRALRDGPHDLTHMENKVLAFFARHPGATSSDLVQHAGRDKAQVARLIKGLRDKGLLEGEADSADRRSVRLRLTEAARVVHESLQQQTRYLNNLAIDGIDDTECRQLVELLERVRANLTDAS